jgi:hypothetical protein
MKIYNQSFITNDVSSYMENEHLNHYLASVTLNR